MIDDEGGRRGEKSLDRFRWAWSITRVGRMPMNIRVFDDEVTAHRDKGSVELEFAGDMCLGMVRIQNDHAAAILADDRPYLGDDGVSCTRSFKIRDQGMRRTIG